VNAEQHQILNTELTKLRNRIASMETAIAGGQLSDDELNHFIKVLHLTNTTLDIDTKSAKAVEPEEEEHHPAKRKKK
jgi:hypothetical protein